MRCLSVFSLVVLLSSAVTATGFGQSPATVSEFAGAPFSATAAELTAAAAVMPPNREYDAQILFEEGTYKFAADGTLAFQQRTIYRLDSANAVKNWAEISSPW